MQEYLRRKKEKEESIDFYTGADYLVINSLLWGNLPNLWRGMEVVHKNNTGVMKEALEMTPEVRWDVSPEEGAVLFEAYKRRTPKEINDQTRIDFIKTAVSDIVNICESMQPAATKMLLYRNVRPEDVLPNYEIGSTIELKGITSTSTTGQEIDYGAGTGQNKSFYRYEISIATNTPVLCLENDERNENEVLLPPMKYKVSNVRNGQAENCKKIIELTGMQTLNVNSLIAEALNSVKKKYAGNKTALEALNK